MYPKLKDKALLKEPDFFLLLYTCLFHLFEVDVGTSGTDSEGSSGVTREASLFSLWLLYAATPAIAAVRWGFQLVVMH